MDTRTGHIHMRDEGESLKDMARRIGANEKDLVSLDKLPEPGCQRCKGTGRVRTGIGSRRFKPCKCTLF